MMRLKYRNLLYEDLFTKNGYIYFYNVSRYINMRGNNELLHTIFKNCNQHTTKN